MDRKTINFNGVAITVAEHEGQAYLPIKPICEALGIAYQSQLEKIKEHHILNSVNTIIVTTGADGKRYEMLHLPVKFVYGWLGSINPGKVAPEAREVVENYCRQCYEVLYRHFHNITERQIKTNEAEIALLKEINEVIKDRKSLKSRLSKLEESLDRLRSERLNPLPELPFE